MGRRPVKTLMHPLVEDRLWIGPQLLDVDATVRRASIETRNISMVINLWHRRDDVLAAAAEQYLQQRLPDGRLNEAGMVRYDALARVAAKHLSDEGNVLIQCYGGRNRSGLLAGLTLCYWLDISGAEALGVVRAGRGKSSLCNDDFARWLVTVP